MTQTLGTTTAPSTTTTSAATKTTTTKRTTTKRTTTKRTTTKRTTTTRTTRTTTTRTTSARHRSVSHTTTTPVVPPTRAQLGMALCLRNVAQSNVLTAAERSQLDSLCRLAWTGHLTPAAFGVAQRNLCVTMVADSGLVGAAATAAARSCEQNG